MSKMAPQGKADMHVHLYSLPYEFSIPSNRALNDYSIALLLTRVAETIMSNATDNGVKQICACQKNSLSQAWQAKMLGKKYGVGVWPGVEVSLQINDQTRADFIIFGHNPNNPQIIDFFDSRASDQNQQKRFLHQVDYIKKTWGIDLGTDRTTLWNSIEAGFYGSEKILFYLFLNKDHYKKIEPTIYELGGYPTRQLIHRHLVNAKGQRWFPSNYLLIQMLYENFFAPGKPGFYPIKKDTLDLAKASQIIHRAGGKIYYSPEDWDRISSRNEKKLQLLLQNAHLVDGIFTHHGAGYAEYTGIRPEILADVLSKPSLGFWGQMQGSDDQGMGVTNVGKPEFTMADFLQQFKKQPSLTY